VGPARDLIAPRTDRSALLSPGEMGIPSRRVFGDPLLGKTLSCLRSVVGRSVSHRSVSSACPSGAVTMLVLGLARYPGAAWFCLADSGRRR
jgi:hypothetical protein